MNLTPAVEAGLVASVFIPAVSSLVVRQHWDSFVAGLITLTLATATGFFSTWAATPDGFRWKDVLVVTGASWAVALMSRIGLLKGTALDAALVAVGSRRGPAMDGP